MAPRVALCVAGHPRTFSRPCVANSLRKHLIVPLQRQASKLTTIVLLKVGDDRTKSAGELEEEAAGLRLAQRAIVGPVTDEWVWEDEAAPGAAAVEVPGCRLQWRHHVPRAWFLGGLKTNADCLSRVEAAETRAGKRFDVVVKVRPDLLWVADLPGTVDELQRTAVVNARASGLTVASDA